MPDISPAPFVPPLGRQILTALAQKALTAAATGLTGWGALKATQTNDFVSIFTPLLVSAILWGISFGWTWLREHDTHENMKALALSPAILPTVAVRDPANA